MIVPIVNRAGPALAGFEGDDRNRTGAACLSLARVAFVPLRTTRGAVRAYALVDPDDALPVAQHRWHLHDHRHHVRGVVDGERTWLHWFLCGEPAPGYVVDHINGWPLDNRRANLRIITKGQNAQNQAARGGYSEHGGVTYDKSRRLWMARGSIEGRPTTTRHDAAGSPTPNPKEDAMSDGPTIHVRLVDAAIDEPRAMIHALLAGQAETQASRLSELLVKAYAEGLRDGFVQGTLAGEAVA